MVREFSAGGVVFLNKKAKNKELATTWLVCRHSQHKGWVFPKGFIGDKIKGESKEDTALREVEEETGAKGRILLPLQPVSYFYFWKGEKHFKTVYYFLMEYAGGDISKHDFEMSDVEWWDTEKVKHELTYKADKMAFEEALMLFEKNIS